MTTYSNTVSVSTARAVTALGKLETALDSAVQAMRRFKDVADQGLGGAGFDSAINGVTDFGTAAERASRRVGDSSRRAGKAVDGIGLSYKDVGRIVESQIIFASINKITQGFFEAADAAAQFQEQLARIAAIDESSLGIAGLRGEIEQLAVDLGRPLAEVSGATFEALQNDLGTTEETFGILRKEAQELALVTGGDLTQAVNALSSVYKTFGAEAEAVNGISGQFFGTINAGRITLGDLESSLGTLSPLATQIGVDFKELTDSLATITLTGTKANVATTQLRNVFNKLIKPTKALEKVYQDLGVKGFEELTKRIGANGEANGFVGALQALEKAVGGDGQEVAKLFNTIRANVGVLNILTDDTELYNKTAERSATSARGLSNAIDGIQGTAAREAAKNAAELEVVLTRLGDRALDLKNLVLDAFLAIGGASEDGVVAIGGFAIGMAGATLAVTKFGIASKVAFPPVIAFLGVLAGAAILKEGFNRLVDGYTSLAKETAKLEVDRLKAYVKTLEDLRKVQLKDVVDQFENLDTVVNKVAASAQNSAKDIVAAFQIKSGDIQATEAALLQAFGDARTRVLKQVEDAIKSIDDKIADGTKRIKNLTQDLEDVKFEFSIEGLDTAAQAAARLQRATDSVGESLKAIAGVGLSEESQRSARAATVEAEAQARSAKSAADQTKSQVTINKAQRLLESAIKTRIALEKRLVSLQEGQGKKALLDQLTVLERLSGLAKEQVQDVLDARKAIADASAEGVTDSEISKLKDALVTEVNEAKAALLETGETEALKTFNLGGEFKKAVKDLTTGLDSAQIDWTKALDGLKEDLASRTDLKAAVELTGKLVDVAKGSGSDEVAKAISGAAAEGGLPGDQLLNTAKSALEIYKEQKGLADIVSDTTAKTDAASSEALFKIAEASKAAKLFGDNAEQLTKPIADQLARINTLSEEQLTTLIETLKEAPAAIAANTEGLFAPFTDEQAKFLNQAVGKTIEAAEAALQGVQARELFDPENLAAAKAVLDEVNTDNLQDLGFEVDSEGFKAVDEALTHIAREAQIAKIETSRIGTEGAVNAVTGLKAVSSATSGLKSVAAAAESSYQALLNTAREALSVAREAAAVNASGGSNFFGGRPQYRNAGGASRGQDVLPTMLAPEEFVMNSQASRNFFPELNALNSGNSVGAGSTSSDTNITIGDINVSTNSTVPGDTARDISTALKRELRRGTS